MGKCPADTFRPTNTCINNIFFSYPSSFIDDQFRKFFNEYIGSSPFLPFTDNEKQLFLMRHEMVGEPTLRRSQVQTSATTADIEND